MPSRLPLPLVRVHFLATLEAAEVAIREDDARSLSDLATVLSDLAQHPELARQLEHESALRYRWDRVWAATDTDAPAR